MCLFRDVCLFITVIALSSSCRNDSSAAINDVSVKVADNPGYSVTAVDGKPPKRRSNALVTVVPYVLLEPGHHVLTIRSDSSADPDEREYTLEADVQKSQSYDLVFRDGTPSLAPQ